MPSTTLDGSVHTMCYIPSGIEGFTYESEDALFYYLHRYHTRIEVPELRRYWRMRAALELWRNTELPVDLCELVSSWAY